MPTKKTRFGIPVKGHLREIFSVEERKNGDLGLYIKHAQNWMYPHEKLSEILEHKYSVHLSQSSAGYKIQRTMTTSICTHRTSQMVFPVDHKTNTLVFAQATCDLSLPRHSMKAKRADAVVQITREEIEHLTFFFMLYISDYPINRSLFRWPELMVHQVDISAFRLTLVSGFLPLTPIDYCEEMHVMTLPDIEPHFAQQKLTGTAESQIAETTTSVYQGLGQQLAKRAKALGHIPSNGAPIIDSVLSEIYVPPNRHRTDVPVIVAKDSPHCRTINVISLSWPK